MNTLQVMQADRDSAWPFRGKCYGHSDKLGWDAGRYDHVGVIQAHAHARLAAEKVAEVRELEPA